MKPLPHQIELAKQIVDVIREHGLVYVSAEERTGKTLSSILAAEALSVQKILILTKKKALEGWEDTLNRFHHNKVYTLCNYHSAHKLGNQEFDLIILDESHSYLSGYPKVGAIWRQVAVFTKDKPIVYLSATPSAQSLSLLYHQFKLSSWSPWHNYKNFYDWHKVYGIPHKIRAGSHLVNQYNKTKDFFPWIKHLFVSLSRTQIGFNHEPNDVVHYVHLKAQSKVLYERLEKTQILEEYEILGDTPTKLLTKLHQICGSACKNETGDVVKLDGKEKLEYLLKTFGHLDKVAILAKYTAEIEMLEQFIPEGWLVGQIKRFAEGVDFSMYDTQVVYSLDFSASTYFQMRARQANYFREKPIDVHFLLVKDSVDEHVYRSVQDKRDFTWRYYTDHKGK